MKFRMPWFAVVFFVCNPAQAREVSPHAARAVETIRQLRALGLPGGSSDETGPPARVPSLLRTLNAELKELILDDLNDRTAHGIPGEDEIMDQLRAAGWEEIPSHKWNAYGEIRQINFDWKTEYDPGVLIISTQLWLPCGSADPDSAIYVFQGRARKWDLVLATESDFDPIGQQDFSGMQYQISPPDEAGRWFLVVGHVPASCRRTELALRYKVLRPGPNSEKPILISSGREVINSLYDPAFRITVQSDWFAVIEGKKRLLDDEPGVAILRYQVGANDARRIHPLALSPEDFLDQWTQLSWDDAKQWAKASPEIQDWHSKLSATAPGSVDLHSVHQCSGSKDGDQTWLLELEIDQPPNPSFRAESLFIEIAKQNGIFLLKGAHTTHPVGCQGRTQLAFTKEYSLPQW